DHFGRQRHDLHVALLAELARHGAEDAGRSGLPLLVDDDDGVLVEPDVAPVLPPRLLGRAHHDGARDVRLLHGAVRQRVLHGHDHDVTQAGITPAGTTQHANDLCGLRARVVRDLDHRFLLDHGSSPFASALQPVSVAALPRYRARSTISTTRHRLSFDKGRVSAIRTVSPVLAVFSSSCAFTRFVRVTILPYTGCGTRRSIATTTVFAILSLTTRPTRVLRVPRSAPVAPWAPVVLVVSAIGLFPQHGLEARDVLANRAQTERLLQRLGAAPELQPEPLLLELANARRDVILG